MDCFIKSDITEINCPDCKLHALGDAVAITRHLDVLGNGFGAQTQCLQNL